MRASRLAGPWSSPSAPSSTASRRVARNSVRPLSRGGACGAFSAPGATVSVQCERVRRARALRDFNSGEGGVRFVETAAAQNRSQQPG